MIRVFSVIINCLSISERSCTITTATGSTITSSTGNLSATPVDKLLEDSLNELEKECRVEIISVTATSKAEHYYEFKVITKQ